MPAEQQEHRRPKGASHPHAVLRVLVLAEQEQLAPRPQEPP
jgi:hypothetical protein